MEGLLSMWPTPSSLGTCMEILLFQRGNLGAKSMAFSDGQLKTQKDDSKATKFANKSQLQPRSPIGNPIGYTGLE